MGSNLLIFRKIVKYLIFLRRQFHIFCICGSKQEAVSTGVLQSICS